MSPETGYLLQTQVLPRIKAAVPTAVNLVGCEDVQELVADTTLMAARILDNAETKGKAITPSNAAYYALQHCRSGRRSVGNSCCDVHGAATQLRRRSTLSSLDEVVGNDDQGEPLMLHDVLSSNLEDPATRACRRMDWSQFLSGLSKRDVSIIHAIVEGTPLSSLARKRGVNLSTLGYHKERLAQSIASFMGGDILIQISRKPRWMDSLDATRARFAVRDERRTL
jgi:hypothetical protein